MSPDLAALVLAAGRGSRLRPLTDTTPKPLLPIGGTTLIDNVLRQIAIVVPTTPERVAVNAHWLADQLVDHLHGRAHISPEQPAALGTAGAVGAIHDWLGDRDLLIANSDALLLPDPDLGGFVDTWDRSRPRLLVVADKLQPDFEGRWRFAGFSLLPNGTAAGLAPEPSGLYEVVWSKQPVEFVPTESQFIDCGTVADYATAHQLVASYVNDSQL